VLQLQLGDSLAEFLVEATPDPKLRQLLMSMSEALRTIAYKVRIIAVPYGIQHCRCVQHLLGSLQLPRGGGWEQHCFLHSAAMQEGPGLSAQIPS
jgi:hypothetical protein